MIVKIALKHEGYFKFHINVVTNKNIFKWAK